MTAMQILTEDALLVCKHELGTVKTGPTQALVYIGGRRLLVEDDPERKSISGCPLVGPGFKPCQLTLQVQTGYSNLLRIDGKRVCLDTVTGLTDGTPPGAVQYRVRSPGQDFVSEGG